jgi:hypothetical protein
MQSQMAIEKGIGRAYLARWYVPCFLLSRNFGRISFAFWTRSKRKRTKETCSKSEDLLHGKRKIPPLGKIKSIRKQNGVPMTTRAAPKRQTWGGGSALFFKLKKLLK